MDVRQAEEGAYSLLARKMASVQIIYNLLEQVLGPDVLQAARETGGGVMCRVPHASGLLEGTYTTETEFAPGDHRSFRVNTSEKRKQWLDDGLQKTAALDFLTSGTGRTLGQSALQWLWSEPLLATALPNIYDEAQLEEFCAAPNTPPLTPDELARVAALYADGFGLASAQPIG